MGIVKCE